MSKYKIIGSVGEGGMGVVYRALQVDLGREVAMKVLPRAADPESNVRLRERFNREIQACLSLQHPNIIRIFDYGEADGQLYYTMELIEARDLDEFVKETEKLSPSQILRILAQAVDALSYCHANGVIHRDIKPHNIMIKPNGQVVLMDFGLTRLESKAGLTKAGVLVGTPRYLAPELILGRPAGDSIDVYALGATAYELACGSRAFDDQNQDLKSLLTRILQESPRPIRELRPEFPPDVEDLILDMLEKDPDLRPNVVETARRVRSLLGTHDPQAELSLEILTNPFTETDKAIKRATRKFVPPNTLDESQARATRKIHLPAESPGVQVPRGPPGSPRAREVRGQENPGGQPNPTWPRFKAMPLVLLTGLAVMGLLSFWVTAFRGNQNSRPSPPPEPTSPPLVVERFLVEPLDATHARVRLDLSRMVDDLTLGIRLLGGSETRTDITGQDETNLENLIPGENYMLSVYHHDSVVEGGRVHHQHPLYLEFFQQDIRSGEDYLTVWYRTFVPHRLEVTVTRHGTLEPVFRETSLEPTSRYWRLIEGLEPKTRYQVFVRTPDTGYRIREDCREIETRGLDFRSGVNSAIRNLRYELLADISGGTQLYDWKDARSVSSVMHEVETWARDSRLETFKLLIHTIGDVGDIRLTPQLVNLFKHFDSTPLDLTTVERKLRLIYALGLIGDPETYETVRERLVEFFGSPRARDTPWEGLEQLSRAAITTGGATAAQAAVTVSTQPDAHPVAERIVSAQTLMLSADQDRATSGLGGFLIRDPSTAIARWCAGSLARIGGPRAADQLRKALLSLSPRAPPGKSGREKDRPGIAEAVLIALGSSGNGPDVTAIEPWISRTQPTRVRCAAAVSLGQLRDPAGTKILLAALADADPLLKSMVIWALGRIGSPARLALPLLEAMVDAREDSRGQLALALAEIGGANSIPLLRKIVDRPGSIGGLDRAGAFIALGTVKDPDSETRYLSGARSGSILARAAALIALGMTGKERYTGEFDKIIADDACPEQLRKIALKCRFMVAPDSRSRLEEISQGEQKFGYGLSRLANQLKSSFPNRPHHRASDCRIHIVPAFLPYFQSGEEAYPGNRLLVLPAGLWSKSGKEEENLCDEEGKRPFHLFRSNSMALLSFAGFAEPRTFQDDLGNLDPPVRAPLLFGVNQPNHTGSVAHDYIPHFSLNPEAVGFMVLFVQPQFRSPCAP